MRLSSWGSLVLGLLSAGSEAYLEAARQAVCVGASAATLTLGTLFVAQRSLLYPAPKVGESLRTYGGKKAQLVRLPNVDGPKEVGPYVHCAFFPPPTSASSLLVFFHGNADQIGWSGADLGRSFRERDAGFLAVEYPGYGLSSQGGKPTETSILWAAERALLYAREQVSGPERIVLFGQSLGCAPALEMATRHPDIQKLVLVAPFCSVAAMAKTIFPFLPERLLALLLKDKFDNLQTAQRLPATTSTLILHGTEDDIVPFSQGETLANLLGWQNKKATKRLFVPIEGAGHNDIFSPPFHTSLFDNILAFSSSSSQNNDHHPR